MDLFEKINSLSDEQLHLLSKRDDASGVLASFRLAALHGLPSPDRTAVIMGEGYAIVAQGGEVQRIAIEGVTKIIREEGDEFCVYSEDGSQSFGCYTTMSGAEARLREIHYFVNKEDGIRSGSFVSWSAGGGTARGQVQRIVRDGVLNVPGSDFKINGSSDDPAALIRVWRESADGWKATETLVGHKVKTLNRIDSLKKAKVSVGDHVLYMVAKPPAAPSYAHGVVDRVEREGTVTIPGTDESVEATSEDPVAVITVWADTESGYKETDRRVARLFSSLRVSQEPLEKASAKVMETLREKAKKHNEDVGAAKGKRTSARTLAAVFERGIGAYRGNPGSVRPSVTSAEQWAYGRVNGFLHALKTGRFKRSPYDTDLLPKEHSLSSKKSVDLKESFVPPEGAQEAGSRALNWIAEGHAGAGFTDVGRARAGQLARGDAMSEETIRRMASFLARHEGDSRAEGFSSGEDGFPSPGRVSWDAWGGDAGKTWADMLVARFNREEKQACPVATGDVAVNLENRQTAIEVADYGPMNPALPNDDYWEHLSEYFGTTPEEARSTVCGNCAAFDVTSHMKDCIADGISEDEVEPDPYEVVNAGDLGYCRIFKFKCASARSCSAWISGGPITDENAETKELAKAQFMRKADEKQFTLGPLYVPDFMDAHGEWTDSEELQNAVWGWVRAGDRRIFLQHDMDVVAGEWVEVMTMPQPWTVEMMDATGESIGQVTYPKDTVFLGVVWNDDAWADVKAGKLRGYSIGGYSDRMMADLPVEGDREGLEIELPEEPKDLTKAIADAITAAMKNAQPVVNVVMSDERKARVRRIERDEHGNISRIIEEEEV